MCCCRSKYEHVSSTTPIWSKPPELAVGRKANPLRRLSPPCHTPSGNGTAATELAPPTDYRGVNERPSWASIEGWFSAEDAAAYRGLVGRIRGGSVVEVGVWKGRSMASVLDLCRARGNRLNAVDDWSPDQRDPGYAEAARVDICEVFRANMRSLGYDSSVTVIRERSVVAARSFGERSVDLVFIDADHHYEDVMQDLKAWLPKIMPRGAIAGHDYHTRLGVRRAVDDTFGSRVALPGGSIWVVRLA
jgi:predicted O-methyltransferase YrrM